MWFDIVPKAFNVRLNISLFGDLVTLMTMDKTWKRSQLRFGDPNWVRGFVNWMLN